jgi:hypothetical protein
MFSSGIDPSSLDNVTHVIQVALTPIFLLSGIAALLNVFSTRLGRVADRVDQLAIKLQSDATSETTYFSVELSHLRRRSLVLDVAVVLGTMGGVATCGSALALFIGALRNTTAASVLFVSGAAPPPCNARLERQDANKFWQIGSHTWLTILLTLQSHGVGSISGSG